MIDDLKPYPEYKDSGLPWLGKVPGHWELIPNRGLVKKRKVLVGKRHKDYQLLSLTKQGVIVRDISTGKGKFSSDMGTSQEVRDGDFVFCLFDVPETPRAVGLSHHAGMITGAYTVLESIGRGNPGYFEKYYLAMDDRKLLSPLYSGLRHTIPLDRLLGTKTPQPPPEEQAAIVRFLGHANGKIERAIRAKRKLIVLLNEQKQAIIHRAVTRGLDPSVKLKPSGIPWLGDVPEHWLVLPFTKSVIERADYRGATPEKVDTGVFLVTAKNVRKGTINYDVSKEYVRQDLYVQIMRRGLPRTGDLLLTMEAPLGHAALVDREDIALAQRLVRFRMNPLLFNCYFTLHSVLSKYFQNQLLCRGTGSTALGIKASKLPQLQILCPPLDEQLAIIDAATRETEVLTAAITRTECEIELLREYRTTLTAEVVTGKLDVREAVKRLPAEVGELPPTEESYSEGLDEEGVDVEWFPNRELPD